MLAGTIVKDLVKKELYREHFRQELAQWSSNYCMNVAYNSPVCRFVLPLAFILGLSALVIGVPLLIVYSIAPAIANNPNTALSVLYIIQTVIISGWALYHTCRRCIGRRHIKRIQQHLEEKDKLLKV